MPRKARMKNHAELTHFAGLDWAKDHHDANIMDRQGRVVARFRFAHSGPGWQEWRGKIRAYPALGVAIETSHGAAVEQLLASGVTVYPVHPQAAKAYRQRQAPSGTKDDELDAWSLGDALRLDGGHWRALSPQDAMVEELRLLCRDEAALIEQRTALVNQLQAALHEYYPAALEAFADWTQPRIRGRLWKRFRRRNDWCRRRGIGGGCFCTGTSCGGRGRRNGGWKSLPGRISFAGVKR